MLLNFYYYLPPTSTTTLLLFLVSASYSATIGLTTYTDIYARTILDDFIINSLYYWWTSFWYIPVFTSTLFIWIIYTRITQIRRLFLLIPLIIVALLLNETHLYWLVSPTYRLFFTNSELVNTLLLNSINKFHPLLLYFTFILTLIFMVNFWGIFFFDKLPTNLNLSRLSTGMNRYYHLITITVSLFLGSWWALQEGSWGGWWNWDPSEVFGLTIMLVYISLLHRKLTDTSTFNYLKLYHLIVTILLLIYIFMQLNFNLTSHNFGTKNNNLIDPLQLFFISITLLLTHNMHATLIFIRYVYWYILVYHNTTTLKYSLNTTLISYLLITIILIYMYFCSFTALINDFIWQLFGINTVISFAKHELIVVWSLIFILLIFYTNNYFKSILFSLIFFLYTTPRTLTYLLLWTLPVNCASIWLNHWFLYLFILTCLLTSKLVTTTWFISNLGTNFNLLGNSEALNFINFSLNLVSVELNYFSMVNGNRILGNTTLFTLTTSSDLNIFLNKFNSYFFEQNLLNSFFGKIFIVLITDLSIGKVMNITCIFLLYYYTYTRHRLLIIF